MAWRPLAVLWWSPNRDVVNTKIGLPTIGLLIVAFVVCNVLTGQQILPTYILDA